MREQFVDNKGAYISGHVRVQSSHLSPKYFNFVTCPAHSLYTGWFATKSQEWIAVELMVLFIFQNFALRVTKRLSFHR